MKTHRVALLSFLLLVAVGLTSAWAQSPANVYYNSFEYSDMRSTFFWAESYWHGSGPVAIGAGEQPNSPAGVYTGSNYLGNSSGNPPIYVNDSSICRTQWCIRYNKSPSTGGGGGMYWLTLGNTLPNQIGQHYFYRAYQKFPVGYQFVYGKTNYMRDFNGNTVIVSKGCSGVCTSTELFVTVGTPSANYKCNQGPSCTITGDNLWHPLEVELDPNGGGSNAATIRMWRDGVLLIEFCSSCTQHATIDTPLNPGGIGFGEYDNAPAENGGFPSQTQAFWLDDLAVSTSRIGTGGALPPGETPPLAPSNLNVE